MTILMTSRWLDNSVMKTVNEQLARLPSLVIPVLNQHFSPNQSTVLVLPVTTVIKKDTSRTTAGNSIPKSEMKTEEALLSTRKVILIWLYLMTICVLVTEIYFNASLGVRRVHSSGVLQGAILTICWWVGLQGSPVCGFTVCNSLLFACLWVHRACLTVVSLGTLF